MKHFLLTMIFAGVALAQQNVSRLIQLKFISPDSAMPIVATFGRGSVVANQEPRAKYVTLSGPAELVQSIEDAIKKIDVAPALVKNIETTFHILLAGQSGEQGAVPKELDGVVQQLRGVFGLKSFRLLETAVIRGRDGAETSGAMPSPTEQKTPARYFIKYTRTQVSGDEKAPRVRFDGLQFTAFIQYTANDGKAYDRMSTINTDIDVGAGQKVVVGKTNVDAASQAIFLVVTAKVVD
ncbi:MAG: hypothetical protein FJW32_13785 [Acidobacteria bacterium]|nr:hypothetical protein [Acidobacteriota bacterium]